MANPHAIYTLGETPSITIERCEGDLAIIGHAEPSVVVESESMPHSAQNGERLVMEHCDDDLALRVPFGTTVSIQRIEGDLHAERLARLEVETVSGDADLSHIGASCVVRRADGDLHATGVTNLALGAVSGDLDVSEASGEFALERVDGDARLRGTLHSFGPTRIDGDLALAIAFLPGHTYQLSVDGDMALDLPRDPDLTLEAHVDGDVAGLEQARGRHGEVGANWGDGRARLVVTVSGDLKVRGAATPARASEATTNTPPASATTPEQNVVAADAKAAPEQPDSVLAVLEALARGDITAAEADDLLAQRL